jgi:hypothetical protein
MPPKVIGRSDSSVSLFGPVFVLLLITAVSFDGCRSNSVQLFSSTGEASNALNGPYAFLLSGFDSSGAPIGIVGSITADGLGHITDGSINVNDNFVISSNSSPLTGNYTLDKNNRGMIAIINRVGSVTQPLAFAFSLKADGSAGDLIEFDTNNFVVAGTMQQQDRGAFSLAALASASGSFAFEFHSEVPSRFSTIGRFRLFANGTSSNAVADASSAGNGPVFSAEQLFASFTASGPDGNGRSTMNMSVNGVTTNYIYYVTNAANVFVLQMAPNISNTLQTGLASKQNLPFSSSTVNTTGSIFALTGSDSGMPRTIGSVGLLQVKGSIAAQLTWDTNDAGRRFSNESSTNGTISFDPNMGRGNLSLTGGSANGLFDQAVFYLTDSGKGFLLDGSAGTGNRALSGSMETQTGGPFSGETISGSTIIRSLGPSISATATVQEAQEGVVSKMPSGNAFAVTTIGDFASQSRPPMSNLASSFTETFAISANTGRGTDTSAAHTSVFYIIGLRQYVMLDQMSPPNSAAITFADPQ